MSDNEEIQNFIDINQLEDSDYCPSISEVKWCRKDVPKKPIKTRDKWYQNYSLPDDNYTRKPNKKPPKKESESEPGNSFKAGDKISAIDAINRKFQGLELFSCKINSDLITKG